MLSMSVRLTIVAFVSIPFTALLGRKYGSYVNDLSERTQTGLAEANSVALETLNSVKTVKSFAAEALESKRFQKELDKVFELNRQSAIAYIFYLSTVMLLPNFVTALIVWYGGELSRYKMINAGQLLAFVMYLAVLGECFATLGDFYSNIITALGAAEKVFDLLERQPKIKMIPDDSTVYKGTNIKGDIEINGVEFYYPSRPTKQIMSNLTVSIPMGKVVALVGPSGSGKSTCIGLIERWYEASKGSVTIDGVPIENFPHQQLHKWVSIVGQEPTLFARTIKENILFGIVNPGEPIGADLEEKIINASRLASVHDFIVGLPDGYDTELGERGVKPSNGQKQRIAIARALVRDPRILLLDEATSSLDSESEAQVQKAIDDMIAIQQKDPSKTLTVIIIAHRLSTVRNADKICVVSGGCVAEQGTHTELVEKQGIYWNLVKSQMEPKSPKKPSQTEAANLSAPLA